MRSVELRSDSWSAKGVAWADTFWDRFLGMRHSTALNGVVLPVRSVHTVGMDGVDLVVLDADLVVIDTRRLPRNRIACFRRARYVVELPEGSTLPSSGSTIEVIP